MVLVYLIDLEDNDGVLVAWIDGRGNYASSANTNTVIAEGQGCD
jgi:hypothetical protein